RAVADRRKEISDDDAQRATPLSERWCGAGRMNLPTIPIAGPAAWNGPALAQDRSWEITLSSEERDELRRALERVGSLPLASVDRSSAPFERLLPVLGRWRQALRSELGFVLVRGVPIEGCSRDEAAALFRLLGSYLGDAVPQNGAGDLICDICDTGADPTN